MVLIYQRFFTRTRTLKRLINMNTRIFLLLALASIAMFSCKPNPYKEEIKELNSLIKEVEKSSTKLVQIDTTGLSQKLKEYKKNVNTITETYQSNNDTIGKELALILSDYRQLKKPYSEFSEAHRAALKELKFTKNQLVTLKHDLENDILEPPVAAKMMQSEKLATRKIIGQVEQLARTDSVTQVKAVKIEAKIDSVISSLSTTQ